MCLYIFNLFHSLCIYRCITSVCVYALSVYSEKIFQHFCEGVFQREFTLALLLLFGLVEAFMWCPVVKLVRWSVVLLVEKHVQLFFTLLPHCFRNLTFNLSFYIFQDLWCQVIVVLYLRYKFGLVLTFFVGACFFIRVLNCMPLSAYVFLIATSLRQLSSYCAVISTIAYKNAFKSRSTNKRVKPFSWCCGEHNHRGVRRQLKGHSGPLLS